MPLGEIRIGNKSRGDEGVFVARPSIFGNPLHADLVDTSREDAVRGYEEILRYELRHPASRIARALQQLAVRVTNGENLTLVCWCAPKRCHAEVIRDVVLELAQGLQQSGGCM